MTISFGKVAAAVLVLSGVGYAFAELAGPNGLPAMLDKRREVRELKAENERLQLQIDQSRDHIQHLESDPAVQEMEIRRRLKLAAPGEKVFIIGESGK